MKDLEQARKDLEEYLQSPRGRQALSKSNAVIAEFNSALKRAETIDPEILRRKLILSGGKTL